jgi:Cu(I)/Ag(I) efflux system membrane fusion protein
MNGFAGKQFLAMLVLLIAGIGIGMWIGPWSAAENSGVVPAGGSAVVAEEAEPEILYWVAPMDPNYRRDEPGKSPMGMDLVPVYADKKQAAGSGDDAGEGAIYINPAVENNLGVRTHVAEIRPLWRRIEATGYVGFDENLFSHIHMRTEGWIERLLVDAEGERVKAGQLLFEFYSPLLVNAQKEYLQAQRRNDERMLAAADEKLRALGMVPAEIRSLSERGVSSQTIQVLAPRDGVITSLNAREGMYLKPETEVMSLADLSSVWMQAEIFESQADWVAQGQSAEASLNYMPGEVFSGQVDYIYPVLDPRTRTLRVRLQFDNPGERLKPNMYASVTIFGRTHQDALSIPRDALIRASGNDRVVVALGDGRYRVHEVMTGIESGEWVEIIAGIAAGVSVVTSAQFLLDSEASLTGSLRRLEAMDNGEHTEKTRTVFGSGRVDEIHQDERKMHITHGPIDALGWPGMTMEFDVLPNVDLGRIQVGQSVHFSIRPNEGGVYLINMVHLVDSHEKMPDEPEQAVPGQEGNGDD